MPKNCAFSLATPNALRADRLGIRPVPTFILTPEPAENVFHVIPPGSQAAGARPGRDNHISPNLLLLLKQWLATRRPMKASPNMIPRHAPANDNLLHTQPSPLQATRPASQRKAGPGRPTLMEIRPTPLKAKPPKPNHLWSVRPLGRPRKSASSQAMISGHWRGGSPAEEVLSAPANVQSYPANYWLSSN